ncbi:hypothetical protein OS493_014835 [Desmophyllum pertusum]|uniref:Uncharacterized protein n=1 Tax=Desmophyllum pertusum TaxID=174260 RepID=A0A9W9YDF6_9CNID|nr:hypothetical protein OS493_014835 [Desmophyllum pertusum]
MASDVVVDREGAGGNPVLQENVPPINGTTSEKRLTKVERARREALSAFGDCPFNALVVKRECFKSKLNATAKNAATRKDSNRRLTRMERARKEANEAFKNISLGQKRKASAIEKKTGTHPVTDNAKKRLTRLERCKFEAQQAFGNVPLSTLTAGNIEQHQEQNSVKTKRPRIETKRTSISEKVMKEKRKSTNKGRQNRRSASRRRSSAMTRQRSSTKGSRLTKVQASQLEALKSFGGQSLENVWKNSKVSSPVVEGVAVTADDSCQSVGMEPVGMEPVAMEPVDMESVGMEPVAMEQVGMEPVAMEPVGMEPVAMEPVGMEPVGMESVGMEPVGREPVGREPVAMEPVDMESVGMEPVDMEPVGRESVGVVTQQDSGMDDCQLVDESTQVDGPSDNELHREGCESNEVNQTTDTSIAQVQNVAIGAPQVETREDHMHTREDHMHTHEDHVQNMKEMTPIPEENTPEASAQSSITHFKNATPVESKPLTRLEKARMESLQSFNGHAFEHVIKTSTRKMARYLTPVKHQGTNTEVNRTRNTPSQTENSYCKRHPRPNNSFYSNLRDNSFCDRGTLLESSKMVVSTARSLDTPSPDCSPATHGTH